MKIVSASLTEKNISDLNFIKKELGLANASEAIRTALNSAVEKIEKEKHFSGVQNAILVIDHSHKTEKFVSSTKHGFQSLVKGQNHYCTTGSHCIDTFLLHGPAEQIKKMRNSFLKNKDLEKIVLVQL